MKDTSKKAVAPLSGDAAGAELPATAHSVDGEKVLRLRQRCSLLLSPAFPAYLVAGTGLYLGAGSWAWCLLGLSLLWSLPVMIYAYRVARHLGPARTSLTFRSDGLVVCLAGREEELPWSRIHGAVADDGPFPGTRIQFLRGRGPFVPDLLDESPYSLAARIDALRWLVGPGSEGREAILPAVEGLRSSPGDQIHPEDQAALAGVTSETRFQVAGYHPPWVHLRREGDLVRVLPRQASPIVIVDGEVRAGLLPPEG